MLVACRANKRGGAAILRALLNQYDTRKVAYLTGGGEHHGTINAKPFGSDDAE
jgi:hypothetical protein